MRKLIVYINSTFNGVVTGDPSQDKTNFMVWTNEAFIEAGSECALETMETVDTILLGRRTYEDLSGPGKWPSVKDWPDVSELSLALGEKINNAHKLVVTHDHPLDELTWGEYETPKPLTGNDVEEQIRDLKNGEGGDIVIFGSPTLVRSLTNADLIDEYQIQIRPVVVNVGERLFDDLSARKDFELIDVTPLKEGSIFVKYRPVNASSQNLKPAESGYADINGLQLYYEVYGEGKPIVLLHGSYMPIPLNWSHIIPLLAKDRKVIATEMQGHGRTRDIAREFSYEGMADDVSGLLKHLNIDNADILGYSMGGCLAFQVAVRHPEQVRRLVVLSGTYQHDGWWPDTEAGFATLTADMFEGTPIQEQYESLGNDPAHFPEFVKKVISIDLKPYDWSKEVKNIQAPIFMAIGDADGVRYEHALELFRAKGGGKFGDAHGLPQSRLAILPGTTHIGMMQRTDWLIPMITDFLDSDLNTEPPTF